MGYEKIILPLFLLTICPFLTAQERSSRYELEAGVISTQNMEIHGYNQGDATSGWKKNTADLRFEYWSTKANDWNYGLVFQPLYISYSAPLTNTLNFKGRTYNSGDSATLQYQFPTLRFSANYPVYSSNHGQDYVRLGGSAVVRFARVSLSTQSNSFNDTNLLAIPLFNMETNTTISKGYSFFTRSDFLPSIEGNTLLDGLFDIFIGIRTELQNNSTLDIGVRSFFGGYDPKQVDDYANRIFFNAAVVRYSW